MKETLLGLADGWFVWLMLVIAIGVLVVDWFQRRKPQPICLYAVHGSAVTEATKVFEEALTYVHDVHIEVDDDPKYGGWAIVKVYDSPDVKKFLEAVNAIATRNGYSPKML